MPRKKSIFQRAKKYASKRIAKFQKQRARNSAKIQKQRQRAITKAQKSYARKIAREARKRERAQQRRRDSLIANRKGHGISGEPVSLAESIIISRLRRKGVIQNYTANDIKDMALRMIGARARSIGFLAAGWLASIKAFAEAIGQPFRAGSGLKAFQKNAIGKLGFAIPAKNTTWRPFARMVNYANAKHDHQEALLKYGQPALQQAFNDEIQSMRDQIEKKLRGSAKSLGIKTN